MEKAGLGNAPSAGIALPPWIVRVWEGAFSMTGYVVNEVRRGDPICVTLTLFLAFFAVVCLSYFQYRSTPRSTAKKAGKSRSRAKKKGAVVVEQSDAVQSTAADGTGVSKKQRKPGQAGTSSSVQAASSTAHANVPLAVENEPTDNDDGGGEWKVVTSRRGKKKES